ncbi:hypothetical protein HELRODRAFT_181382 [Helobdella robusta]|uniref:C-type lectin domain-containing protein n=1 Tax=Helobdella robusta TaxID=6412 RepID=T1FGY1_HELRO|nr:hypothetical protein HELRODRAFT_181382 [Helobdella robusta]ESN92507.1 hypothetical protein HELRODRAFT_181382 [Helobdella robusta]
MKSLLVSVGSVEESSFLVEKSSENDYWIGMYRLSCSKNESHSYWLDGSNFDFVNWMTSESEPNEDTCCSRIVNGGMWRDKFCHYNGCFYICEKPASTFKLQIKGRAYRRLADSYVGSDSLEVVYNKRCLVQFCMVTCLQNWICAGFNMRPALGGDGGSSVVVDGGGGVAGCNCELKDARSWLTSEPVPGVGASYWSYPIYGYDF